MAAVDRVVTPEVRQVTNQFEGLVESRDIVGLGFIAIVGSVGVALANEVVDMVLPRVGFNPDPQRAQDFAAAGVVQLVWAFLLVGIASSVGFIASSSVLFAGAISLAIGAVIIGGANLFEWGQRIFASFTETRPLMEDARTVRDAPSADRSAARAARSAVTDGGRDPNGPTAATG